MNREILPIIAIVLSVFVLSFNAGRGVGSNEAEKHEPFVFVPIGVKEITCYKAITAECGNNKGYGAYGKRIAIDGHPTGKYFANNFLPRGTVIFIPEISGSELWTLEDRLQDYVIDKKGKRHYIGNRIDLLVDKDSYKVGKGLRHAKVFIVKKTELKKMKSKENNDGNNVQNKNRNSKNGGTN